MITLSKIAKLAHVSVSTASKAFSGSSEVNEQTREMIFNVAKENGCFKKFFNAKYPKFVISIICPEFKSRYYSRYLYYLQQMFWRRNCEICVASTEFSPETESSLLEYYDKFTSVDGIIIIDGRDNVKRCCDVPIVSIGKEFTDVSMSVTVKETVAMKKAIAYWVKRGVRDIGFIGEKYTNGKREMFEEITEKLCGGVNRDYICMTSKRFEAGGYEAMKHFYENKTVPRAVICAYDNMAIGAMNYIHKVGGRIPDDVAVIGMDNIEEAGYLNPPLASIETISADMLKYSVDMLINIINGKPYEKQKSYEPKLIMRESALINGADA